MKKTSDRGWKAFDFGCDQKSNSPPTKKTKKVTVAEHSAISTQETELTGTRKSSFNFINTVAPKSESDLAVHPKKVQEVEDWLKSHVGDKRMQSSPMLLISGPTGSAKSTTVNLLCNKLGISISEWVNPMDYDYDVFRSQGQISTFVEFLTESKWSSLFEIANNKRITLVKDFPNAVIHQPTQFDNVLEECFYKTNYPIIFICTDTSTNDINLSKLLFSQEIIMKYNITHISFNSCAATLMKNVIKRANLLVQEHPDLFKQPSTATIDAILATAMGDIRNAINQFYFASLIGTKELPTITRSTQKIGNKRKRNDKTVTLQYMSRDVTLGLFHGLGRVLNPKKNEFGRLNCNIEKLIDEFSDQPSTFISFLFENYLKYFGDITDANKATDILSQSDRFLDNWGNNEILVFGLWISVLGLMIFNEHKVSKWNQIRGPTRIVKTRDTNNETVGLKPTDYFYYNIINKTDTFHKFQYE